VVEALSHMCLGSERLWVCCSSIWGLHLWPNGIVVNVFTYLGLGKVWSSTLVPDIFLKHMRVNP
jgi:hypothetical protein